MCALDQVHMSLVAELWVYFSARGLGCNFGLRWLVKASSFLRSKNERSVMAATMTDPCQSGCFIDGTYCLNQTPNFVGPGPTLVLVAEVSKAAIEIGGYGQRDAVNERFLRTRIMSPDI